MSLEDSDVVSKLNAKIESLELEVVKLKQNMDAATLCFNQKQEQPCPFRARPLNKAA